MPTQRTSRHIHKRLSPAERAKYRELRATIEREEKDELRAHGKRIKARHDQLRSVFRALRAERERQGVSLGELARCSGLDKANLSRLESAEQPNVTLATIERYAEALGKEVRIVVTDPQAA